MSAPAFKLPDTSQRLAIVGRTGSGKTQFGAWTLSKAPFHVQPYVMLDWKGDELLDTIDYVAEIGPHEAPPKRPGLYKMRLLPDVHDEALEEWFYRVWQNEDIGVYIDEGYMVPKNSRMFRACLTQGRSKHIPMTILTQRPVNIDKFVFSEADFHAVFQLSIDADIKRCREYITNRVDYNAGAVGKYECQWVDVAQNAVMRIAPVPSADELLQTFSDRLKPKRRFT